MNTRNPSWKPTRAERLPCRGLLAAGAPERPEVHLRGQCPRPPWPHSGAPERGAQGGARQDGDVPLTGAGAHAVALGNESLLAEMEKRIEELERLILIDPLTGLLNRRGFEKALEHELAVCRRYGERGVLLLADLDGFKLINDNFGHAAGDTVLKHVARVLRGNVRESDHVGRLGGDEFVVLLVRIREEDGVKRAGTVRKVMNNSCVRWKKHLIVPQASIGVIPFDGTRTARALLKLADAAMYQEKRGKPIRPPATSRLPRNRPTAQPVLRGS